MGMACGIVPGTTGGGTKTIMVVPSQHSYLTYNGNARTPTWDNYDTNKMTIVCNSQTEAGTYTATVTPINNCRWLDTTTTAKTIYWSINRAKIGDTSKIISQSNDTVEFSDGTITAEWNNSPNKNNANKVIISGDTGKNAGTYTAYMTPTNNYCWDSGTFEPRAFTWVINKKNIAEPTVKTTSFTYKKDQFSVLNITHDINYVTTQNDQAINVGNYIAICKLIDKSNTQWATSQDVIDKEIGWSITKATPTFQVDTKTNSKIVFSPFVSNVQLKYIYSGDGVISVTPSETGIVSCKVDKFNQIITITAEKTGSCSVTIKANASNNFNESSSYNYIVMVNKPCNIIDTFGEGTTLASIKYDYILKGNASNYIRVGDYFPITLNGYVAKFPDDFSNDIENDKVAIVLNDYKVYAFVLGINHNSEFEGTNRVHFCLGMLSDTEADTQDRKEFTQIAFQDKHASLIPYLNSYRYNSTYFSMWPGGVQTNKWGWENSNLRYVLNGDENVITSEQKDSNLEANSVAESLYTTYPSTGTQSGIHPFIDLFPEEVKSLINKQTKYSVNPQRLITTSNSDYDTNVIDPTATIDKLWIISAYEIKGPNNLGSTASVEKEAATCKMDQYDFYKNGNSEYAYPHSNTKTDPSIGIQYLTRSISKNNENFMIWKTSFIGLGDARASRPIRPCFTI